MRLESPLRDAEGAEMLADLWQQLLGAPPLRGLWQQLLSPAGHAACGVNVPWLIGEAMGRSMEVRGVHGPPPRRVWATWAVSRLAPATELAGLRGRPAAPSLHPPVAPPRVQDIVIGRTGAADGRPPTERELAPLEEPLRVLGEQRGLHGRGGQLP